MEEIIKLLKTEPSKAIEQLTANSKDPEAIKLRIEEYHKLDRSQRDTQIGQVQKDKNVGTGEKAKTVKGVRIPANYQKKIVETATAFEVGEPVTLIPNVVSELSKLIDQLWRRNRIDDKVQRAKLIQKSQTQAALQFYIQDIDQGNVLQRILAAIGFAGQKKIIKANVLDNRKGKMTPVFDIYGDMKAFVWETEVKEGDKDKKIVWVYDEAAVHVCETVDGKFGYVGSKAHGFGKIPIVYLDQEEVEWFDAQAAIDRREVTLSKLGASNDYSGHPMLKIFGEVENAPDKDEDGKAWFIPIKKDENDKEIKGDVEFLTNDQAVDSVKLELDELNDSIYDMTSTPNISLRNMKGIGADSSLAIKLMFLEPLLKAKLNEGENRTMYERIISVMTSGIITTTNQNLKGQAEALVFDVQFNSILPDDFKTTVETISAAVGAGVMSKKTGVKILDVVEDIESELSDIAADTATKTPEPPKPTQA